MQSKVVRARWRCGDEGVEMWRCGDEDVEMKMLRWRSNIQWGSDVQWGFEFWKHLNSELLLVHYSNDTMYLNSEKNK